MNTTMLTTKDTSYLPPIETSNKMPATKMSSNYQRHFILQTQGFDSACNNEIGMAEREHITSLSSQTVPLDEPLSSSRITIKGNFTPLFTNKMPRTIPADKVSLKLIIIKLIIIY